MFPESSHLGQKENFQMAQTVTSTKHLRCIFYHERKKKEALIKLRADTFKFSSLKYSVQAEVCFLQYVISFVVKRYHIVLQFFFSLTLAYLLCFQPRLLRKANLYRPFDALLLVFQCIMFIFF